MEVTSNKATKAWHQYSLKKDTKQPQLTQFLNREDSARAINKKTSIVNHNFSPFEVFRGVQDPTIKEKGGLTQPVESSSTVLNRRYYHSLTRSRQA